MVNGKLEVCAKRGPRQKYYYDLVPIFGNIILTEREKKYLHTSKIMSCKGVDNGPKKHIVSFSQNSPMV